MDERTKPDPLNERKARQAAEGKATWGEYRAREDEVNANMERLRAQRLANLAAPKAVEEPPAAKLKRKNG
jgi:hypothetical protein